MWFNSDRRPREFPHHPKVDDCCPTEENSDQAVAHLLGRVVVVLEHMSQVLEDTEQVLKDIRKEVKPPKATSLIIQFQGEPPGMPGLLTDIQSVTATVAEADSTGAPVTVDPTKLTWTVGDPTIASATPADDGSCVFKALKVGSTTVGVTDSASGLSGQDTLNVTASAATSLSIAFGPSA
jgi:hypothetical protein